MMTELFLGYFSSFKRYVPCSPEQPALLLMDNNDSHMSYDLFSAAKEMGLQILTFPPLTSNKLQPHDVNIYSPLTSYFYQAIENLLRNHPGRPVMEYKISKLLGAAFPKAFTPLNIMSGFFKLGIHPFNPDVWQEFYTDSVNLCADTDDSLHLSELE
jgi:hypothetical protein